VIRGIGWVKAHPEARQLPVSTDPSPVFRLNGGGDSYGYRWTTPFMGQELNDGLRAFLGDPARGVASMEDLGGNRDRILRDFAIAAISLGRSNRATRGTGAPASASVPAAPPIALATANLQAHSGSISGTVVGRGSSPASHILIRLAAVDSLDYNLSPAGTKPFPRAPSSATLIPATISLENGQFAIHDLPPGFYLVRTPGLNGAAIEVKSDRESKVNEPIVLVSGPQG
jgi:hypothetical protein